MQRVKLVCDFCGAEEYHEMEALREANRNGEEPGVIHSFYLFSGYGRFHELRKFYRGDQEDLQGDICAVCKTVLYQDFENAITNAINTVVDNLKNNKSAHGREIEEKVGFDF